jgi:DUF1009 family protein
VTGWRKLGVIAGGGDLPVALAEHLQSIHASYFVARIAPYADPSLETHPGVTLGLGAMGARMQAMRQAGVDAVVLIGQIPRPDVSQLELDAGALAMLPAIVPALSQGDDALLRAVLAEHERAGFKVVGVEAAMEDLLAGAGVWGAHAPNEAARKDLVHAAKVAALIGAQDIGQGVVVCDGVVLAVEAQEGTDAMLARISLLAPIVRGSPEARRGVLVKRPKPIQERRVDLPTVGVRTVKGAVAAGLAGIGVEAGAALAVRRSEMIAEADRLGVFLYGFTRAEIGEL